MFLNCNSGSKQEAITEAIFDNVIKKKDRTEWSLKFKNKPLRIKIYWHFMKAQQELPQASKQQTLVPTSTEGSPFPRQLDRRRNTYGGRHDKSNYRKHDCSAASTKLRLQQRCGSSSVLVLTPTPSTAGLCQAVTRGVMCQQRTVETQQGFL